MTEKAGSPQSDLRTRLIRVLWLLTVCAAFVVQLPVLRASFDQVKHQCAEPDCRSGQLTAEATKSLHAAGIPLDAFAVWDDLLLLVGFAVFCLVGGLIIWRRGLDRMGVLAGFTLVLFGGVTFPMGGPIDVLHLQGPTWGPIVNMLALAGSAGIGLFIYLFPNGRFVPRWMFVVAVAWVLFQLPAYLAPGSALDAQDANANGFLSFLWVSFLILTMVGGQIYRYRSVSDAAERQQTKWVVLGIVGSFTTFLALVVVSAWIPAVSRIGPLFLLYQSVFRFVMLPIPIGIGFAMLRYRLWDVDLLINRALVYAALTVSIIGVYVAGVVGLQSLFRAITGQRSEVAVAIVTLAVAALFNPWRHRIQGFVDRRFYRRRYDAGRTLARFSGRLRDEVDLEAVKQDLVGIAHETMQPTVVSLWLMGDEA